MKIPKYKEGDRVQVEGWGSGKILKVLDPYTTLNDPYYSSQDPQWYNVHLDMLNNDYDMPENSLTLIDRPKVMKVTDPSLLDWLKKMKKAGYF